MYLAKAGNVCYEPNHNKETNRKAFYIMKTKSKIEIHAEQWVKQHPKATPTEAFVAGYWKCSEAWCNKET
jgi:hypothetical protein